MAILTPLDLARAQAIGARFGLRVTGVRGLLAGSVNSNFELSLVGGERVFLRIYEEQTRATAVHEAARLEHLATRGVPTPRPLRRVDQPTEMLDEHEGKPVALFPWVAGAPLRARERTPKALEALGRELGRVHVAGATLDAPASRFDATKLAERLDRLRATKLDAELAAAVTRLDRTLAEVGQRTLEPGGLVHADLFPDNVLWEGGELRALLDFESACRESYAFDFAVTALSWCFLDRLETDLVRALARGYVAARPFAPESRARLFADFRFAAVRFSITRITDFELRPRGTGVYKDFRRFIARLDAIESLGAPQIERLFDAG